MNRFDTVTKIVQVLSFKVIVVFFKIDHFVRRNAISIRLSVIAPASRVADEFNSKTHPAIWDTLIYSLFCLDVKINLK